MRCDECKTDPLTPGHYCECCGRKLSLQERKAPETSWVEPAPVVAAPTGGHRGDRLVGVHLTPEPYVDPVPDPVAAAYDAQAPVDPVLEAHFAGHAPVEPAPAVHGAAEPAFDSLLEAHFAGHVLVEPAPVAQVAAAVAIEAVPTFQVAAALPIEAALVSQVAAALPIQAALADAPAAHLDSDAPAARCDSCGGPAEDGELCVTCQQAFHAVLDSTTPAADAVASARHVAPAVAFESEVSASASEAPAELAVAASAEVAAPALASPAIRVKTAPPAAVLTPAAVPTAKAAPSLPKAPKPVAPVAAAIMAPSRQPSRARTIGAAAALVVAVAAIGFPLGKLWLGGQEASPIVRDEQPTAPVKQAVAPAPQRAVTPPVVVAPETTTARAESKVPAPLKAAAAPAPPKASPAVTPRPAAARVPSKTVRPVAARPAAVPPPVPAAPAPAPAPPAPVVAPEPKPEPPAAPIGPFFELRDVNETPRVASRVEPHVPDDLRDRALNEVVIVRVLVTQTGHPLMINLLRRSKAGSSLDDAIVAAVKQWTFVPARKRGEAVSCWFHVGVPVTNAN